MHKLRSLSLFTGAALVCAMLGLCSSTKADTRDKKTAVTFGEPVEVPGTALPAGTYVFKLARSRADRHLVQIFNEDETQLITTVRAVPTSRAQTTAKPVFTFDESYPDSPELLHTWFYPGDDIGNEFVYPENQHSPNGYYGETNHQ